ncbi:hypothetical protein DFO53_1064 [Enterobacter sp. AG5470]|nr:hypothetical protein DFO53_1064 [Enterobacter sp. AG5470]
MFLCTCILFTCARRIISTLTISINNILLLLRKVEET